MKFFSAFIIALVMGTSAMADTALPFPVTIGGQAAALVDGDTICAHVAKPVAAGAAMGVKGVEGQVIVNIFKSDDKGVVANGVQPAILLFDAKATKSINDNMAKTKLAPGWYSSNVVAGGKTSRVVFQVK